MEMNVKSPNVLMSWEMILQCATGKENAFHTGNVSVKLATQVKVVIYSFAHMGSCRMRLQKFAQETVNALDQKCAHVTMSLWDMTALRPTICATEFHTMIRKRVHSMESASFLTLVNVMKDSQGTCATFQFASVSWQTRPPLAHLTDLAMTRIHACVILVSMVKIAMLSHAMEFSPTTVLYARQMAHVNRREIASVLKDTQVRSVMYQSALEIWQMRPRAQTTDLA
mmetsp:Transcript_11077/g.41339  ORF Transcript_11077/g.41339 Transcript_11077/m.41339 type:complete len:226 (+) Transcript_11077:3518-4195(+)